MSVAIWVIALAINFAVFLVCQIWAEIEIVFLDFVLALYTINTVFI